MEMIDREKVIKGLECCINERKNIPDCEHCPYCEIDETCTSLDDLHSDALALINVYEQFFESMYQFSNDLVRIATTGGGGHADG